MIAPITVCNKTCTGLNEESVDIYQMWMSAQTSPVMSMRTATIYLDRLSAPVNLASQGLD